MGSYLLSANHSTRYTESVVQKADGCMGNTDRDRQDFSSLQQTQKFLFATWKEVENHTWARGLIRL